MYTEDEAKTKWCPMVRLGSEYSKGTHNRLNNSCMCIASVCMMWREATPIWKPDPTGKDVLVWIPRGYCGLAGK